MPKKVYNNVIDQKIIDNKRVCEDVTKFTAPTLEHPTTTINAAGMVMEVDMPDSTRFKASNVTIDHNNGVNCRYLSTPGTHKVELRSARQKYNVAKGGIEYESVKIRFTGQHVSTKKGDFETGNPYGSTEEYSILRYEEEIDGEIVTLIDAMTGDVKWNGVDYSGPVKSLL